MEVRFESMVFLWDDKIPTMFLEFMNRGCVKMMHPLFRYIIIVLPFFIEYDLCFSYVHAFWWYNVL